MDSQTQNTSLQRLQNVEKTIVRVLELAGGVMDELANPTGPRKEFLNNHCREFMQMIKDIQFTLRNEIKSACEYRPFEKCDYSSRIANEICSKKLEYIVSQLDAMKQTVGMTWEGIVGPLVAKKYGKDLTRLARRGKLDPLIGWDDEVGQCILILGKMGRNNPIIICEPGVAKTTIAERLAQRIVQADVPDQLLNRRKLIYLDVESLVACQYFEKRLKVVLKEATSSNGQTILFIDMVDAGATSGAMDAGCNLLKTMFRQGKLQCIVVATTAEEYRNYIERDRVLARSFQQVLCLPPTVEDTISIPRGLRERYELHHGVKISDNALVSSAILADRYITDGFMPDKAIDLVNEAAVKLKMKTTSIPTLLDRARLKLEKLFLKKVMLLLERSQ